MGETVTQEDSPSYTATTEDDLLARAAKTVDAYVLTCRYCGATTKVCKDVPKLVQEAKRVGMMVVTLDSTGIFGPTTVVCAECAKRPVSSFRHTPEEP